MPSVATSYIYMLPLGGAVTKPWGKSDYGFPCCWGTLSESFAKLGDSIFFASPDASTFYVNLFTSATAKWAARPGVSIVQLAHFPADAKRTATLTVHVSSAASSAAAAATFALAIRVPSWLLATGSVSVNGVAAGGSPIAGRHLTLSRAWADGDVVEVAFPPSLWAAPLNDFHPEQVTISL